MIYDILIELYNQAKKNGAWLALANAMVSMYGENDIPIFDEYGFFDPEKVKETYEGDKQVQFPVSLPDCKLPPLFNVNAGWDLIDGSRVLMLGIECENAFCVKYRTASREKERLNTIIPDPDDRSRNDPLFLVSSKNVRDKIGTRPLIDEERAYIKNTAREMGWTDVSFPGKSILFSTL